MAREISGATFAENGCAENKKPLNQQGFIVFGAGNQVRTGDLLAYQQFNLWLYELVLDAVDGTDDKVVDVCEEQDSKVLRKHRLVAGSRPRLKRVLKRLSSDNVGVSHIETDLPEMKNYLVLCLTLTLIACGPSQDEKEKIAAVSCAVMSETRNMDAAIRVREMNAAREKIGGEPFLRGDDAIKEAFEYGLCEELVLNAAIYDESLGYLKDAERERERIAAEERAERERITTEERTERERIATEKRAEEERIATEKRAEEVYVVRPYGTI